jgi:hypothetical protein
LEAEIRDLLSSYSSEDDLEQLEEAREEEKTMWIFQCEEVYFTGKVNLVTEAIVMASGKMTKKGME